MADYIRGTRTSDTAIRTSDGEVILKDDPGLIDRVARLLCWKHGSDPSMSLGGDQQNFLWMEWEDEAEAAITLVLQAVEAEEIARSYDEDHRISRFLARKYGIEL